MIELNIKVKQVNDNDGLDFQWIRFYSCESTNRVKADRYNLRDKFWLSDETDLFYYSPVRFESDVSFAWDTDNSIYYLTKEYEVIDFDCTDEEIDKWIEKTNNSI